MPWILVSYPPEFRRLCQVYQEIAGENGRTARTGRERRSVPGRSLRRHRGAGRRPAARPPTTPASRRTSAASDSGRRSASPEDAEKYPARARTRCCRGGVDARPDAEASSTRLAGTVDQVKREIDSVGGMHDGGELEWFGWFFDQGFMPWDEEQRQIELFARHVIPEFRDTPSAATRRLGLRRPDRALGAGVATGSDRRYARSSWGSRRTQSQRTQDQEGSGRWASS